jgi:hypothetical protein
MNSVFVKPLGVLSQIAVVLLTLGAFALIIRLHFHLLVHSNGHWGLLVRSF